MKAPIFGLFEAGSWWVARRLPRAVKRWMIVDVAASYMVDNPTKIMSEIGIVDLLEQVSK